MRLRTAALLVSACATALTHPTAATLPSDDKTIVHVLNRIAFGARPGDIERVRAMGLQRYLEQQLHPDHIDDGAMPARLSDLETIAMSSREISEKFEQPMLEARRDRKQDAANNNPSQPTPVAPQLQQGANGVLVELTEQKLLRAVYSERQLQEVLTDFWFNHFNIDARKGRDRFLLTEYERDAIRPHVLGKFHDLLEATAKSPAMLFYLDNWLSADPNGPHRQADGQVRPMGRNRGRVAGGPRRSPARPGAGGSSMPQPAAQPNNRRNGLNENYARELRELHTLGVDGGYTQKDVTEVARAFTGWTIDNPRQSGAFRFDARIHDEGEKAILGHRIKAGGGISDGEHVLEILARHPSTARFIATKLARRFVSDTPPASLVNRLAARFTDTDGDLRAVMTTLLTSPEFLSPDVYRAKVKTPFEFVVSSVRATGADLVDARPLARSLQDLGMPLYQCQPPTGYKDTADAWANTGALVSRMNFALSLASGRMPGPPNGRAGALGRPQNGRTGAASGRTFVNGPERAVEGWEASVDAALAHDVSEATRATIAKAATVQQRVALALGSPEFQKR
jgi:uncharacterized protein (DUF1800 family)